MGVPRARKAVIYRAGPSTKEHWLLVCRRVRVGDRGAVREEHGQRCVALAAHLVGSRLPAHDDGLDEIVNVPAASMGCTTVSARFLHAQMCLSSADERTSALIFYLSLGGGVPALFRGRRVVVAVHPNVGAVFLASRPDDEFALPGTARV